MDMQVLERGNPTITVREAARIVGVSAPTMKRYALKRLIRHLVIGSRVRFYLSDVQIFKDKFVKCVDASKA